MHWVSFVGLGMHRIGQVGPRGAGSVRAGPSRAQ